MPSSKTGVAFTNILSEAHAAENRIREDGSGVALGDVDGDGRCDIFLCGLDGPNRLYRNLGDWKFEEAAGSQSVACADQYSTGAAFADHDGDGDLDLFVNGLGVGARCFVNDGAGRFTESGVSGLIRRYGSTSLAFADIDGDGDLDLYVANYRTDTIRDAPPGVKAEFFRAPNGSVIVEPANRFMVFQRGNEGVNLIERGEPDFLYLNDGQGRFAPVAWNDGTFRDEDGTSLKQAPLYWGLSVMFRDLNADGAPDIYVCNDFNFSPDEIWINDGKGKFQALPKLAMRQMSWSSMAADFADFNRDGHMDFVTVEMLSRDHRLRQTQRLNFRPEAMRLPFGVFDNRPEYMRNALFLNRGDGTFAEIAQFSGVDASEWTWSVIFLDVDLDGYDDLLMANGSGHDILDADIGAALRQAERMGRPVRSDRILSMFPALRTANLAFQNQRDLRFVEVGKEWGFDLAEISNAMALGDLDNDGDLDVVLNNLNAESTLLRNDSTAARVTVRLKGKAPNTRGVGAMIKVEGGPVRQDQEMICGGRYLSGDDALRTFAAGSPTNRLRIEVRWRSGQQSVIEQARANRLYEIEEASVAAAGINVSAATPTGTLVPSTASPAPLFKDVSGLLQHQHVEEPFDDFARQPLLPKKLSQLGPGVCWFDLDGDGDDDLILGAGKGGRLSVFQNQGGRGFKPLEAPNLSSVVARDLTAVVAIRTEANATTILAGSSNYEDGLEAGPCVLQWQMAGPGPAAIFPGHASSTGPLALADMDADGDLDLFVGGRVLPGQYPSAASSLLFRKKDGKFTLDLETSIKLSHLGLVSGAVWSDLNDDGWPELILACEWGPVRVFANEKGSLSDATEALGLDHFQGWWNGVTTGDFNGDGKLDIAASNWGRNTKYESRRAEGLRLFYGDLQGKGTLDTIEAYLDPDLKKVVPWRSFEVVGAALPFVRERFSTFREFSTASVETILGDRHSKTKELRINWLDSTVFLNRDGKFEALSLPPEAQFAPAFGIVAADLNGDGFQDLFLSQNFFPVEMETSRYDSGRGTWLRGDGTGRFTAVAAQDSGIMVYGDQRGCAVADYDQDGRLDLVVAQNANPTVLYRNEQAISGLRIKLKGDSGNPDGIGAAVRVAVGEQLGPAHEIHAGSGYWSQNSATLVIGARETPSGINVRWPGGRVTRSALPTQARSVEINSSGAVRIVQSQPPPE